MAGTKLSYSRGNVYNTCGRLFEIQYVEGIRTTGTTSALQFGKALDEAFNRLLLEKKPLLTPTEELLLPHTPEAIFLKEFVQSDITAYYKSDLDPSLLSHPWEDHPHGSPEAMADCFESLKAKGLLLIEAYRERVMPLIEEVISIQEEVNLPKLREFYI